MLPSTPIPSQPYNGLVVDLFAGGGGASEGLAIALGRDPDIAINHDPEALAMHKANHPGTKHLLNDITRLACPGNTSGYVMAAPFRGVDGRWYVDVLAGSQVNGPGRYTRAHATPFATPYEQGTHRLCRCVPCSYAPRICVPYCRACPMACW